MIMKAKSYILAMALILAAVSACNPPQDSKKKSMSSIKQATIQTVKDSLIKKYGQSEATRINKGVEQAAMFWKKLDGKDVDFKQFCYDGFCTTGAQQDSLFDKLCNYFEVLRGHYNMMTIELMRTLHEPKGEIMPIDEMFGSYDVTAHFEEDMYGSKIAFMVLLNFPNYSLAEKNELGIKWTARQWGYARMGDMFVSRVPANLLLKASEVMVNGDNYISSYNIYMGNLVDDKGKTYFPADKVLITHWGLRDELKSNYGQDNGLYKQKMIYEVMKHIINQSIPQEVINNPDVQWNPMANKVLKDGKDMAFNPEPDTRYSILLENFKAQSDLDTYFPFYETTIERKFDGEMEMSQPDVEKLFVEFVSSPTVRKVGQLIKQRLGRELEPFDIWYDGFKARSGMNEAELDQLTQKKYPDNLAFKNDLALFLVKLGFDKEKADYIAAHISVDPARGSGHAWGSETIDDVAHLRTRIVEGGMDYKGYNIAVHEFGHNVEQIISLHFVDNYMIKGVPNTAFTEALAFLFQKRDLQLLDMKNEDSLALSYQTIDNFWSLYEIMGVALVDMEVWKWMYANPKCTPAELKNQVVIIAKDIWNKYYADVFGKKDEPILAIYSHMIDNPLYLSAYPIGHIIEFQLEQHLKGKIFADEILRIFSQGSLTPDVWLLKATGSKLSTKPLIDETEKAINIVRTK